MGYDDTVYGFCKESECLLIVPSVIDSGRVFCWARNFTLFINHLVVTGIYSGELSLVLPYGPVESVTAKAFTYCSSRDESCLVNFLASMYVIC